MKGDGRMHGKGNTQEVVWETGKHWGREGRRTKTDTGEMALWLRALATPPGALRSFPEPTWHFATIYNYSSSKSNASV